MRRAVIGSIEATARLASTVLRVEGAALREIGMFAESLATLIHDAVEQRDGMPERIPVAPKREPRPAPREQKRQAPSPRSRRSRPRTARAPASRAAKPRRTEARPPRAEPPTPSPPPLQSAADATVSQPTGAPAHVDEEAVLVSESADRGAEEGAGAAVHVQEPWVGYHTMHASEILDRLSAVSNEELSLILVHEAHPGRHRQTVLEAAERELARRTAGVGSPA